MRRVASRVFESRAFFRLAALVVVFGAVVRAGLLFSKPLWADEVFTLLLARRSAAGILDALLADSGPPLHYLLAHLVLAPFDVPGAWDVLVRALSLAAFLGHVPLLLRIGDRTSSLGNGLVAAALLSAFPLSTFYSAEGRAYLPASFFVLLAFERALALRKAPSWGAGLVAGLSAGAAFLFHYLAAFPLLGLVAVGLAPGKDRRPALPRFLAAGGLAALLAASWLPVALRQPRAAMAWMEAEPFAERLASLVANLGLGVSLSGFDSVELRTATVALAGAVLVARAASRTRVAASPFAPRVVLLALAGVGIAYAASPAVLLPERTALLLLPFVALVFAEGPRALAALVTLVGVGATAAQLGAWTAASPAQRLAESLLPAARDGLRISAVGLWGPELDYRLAREGLPGRVVLFPSDVKAHPGWVDETAIPGARLRAEARALFEGPERPDLLVLPRGSRLSAAFVGVGRRIGGNALLDVVDLRAGPVDPPPARRE